MITLDQIRALEARVEKAVSLIDRMKAERTRLVGKLEASEKRVSELESFIETVRKDQARIEEGISNALMKLDAVEDFMLMKAESSEGNGVSADEASEAVVGSTEASRLPASDVEEARASEERASVSDDTAGSPTEALSDTEGADRGTDELDIF